MIRWIAVRLVLRDYTEPFALLVGQLAYEAEGGPELAYRFEHFDYESD